MSALNRKATLAAACLLAIATQAPAQQLKPLIVAEPTHGTGYLPLYVAIRKGFFSDLGLDVKIMTVESGSGHTNAVLTGQAFAFIGGPEHNAREQVRGEDLDDGLEKAHGFGKPAFRE